MMKKIALGCDHAAVDLKNHVKEYLEKRGIETVDFGTNSYERCDYPVYALAAANAVASGECDGGILFCGTGIGISLAANKVKGIRCAVVSDCYSAKLSREHNDANMLAMGARVVGPELALLIVQHWLDAEYEYGIHVPRVAMIHEIEETGKIGGE